MSNSLLTTTDLSISYGAVKAVRGSNLEVKEGEEGLGRVTIDQGAESSYFNVPPAREGVTLGMRHAAGLAGFGMWLRGEGVTADQVRSMLLDSSSDSDPVRGDLRRMIDEALKLADSER